MYGHSCVLLLLPQGTSCMSIHRAEWAQVAGAERVIERIRYADWIEIKGDRAN